MITIVAGAWLAGAGLAWAFIYAATKAETAAEDATEAHTRALEVRKRFHVVPEINQEAE